MPGGRPPKEIDKEEFEKLCMLQCTIGEFEAWFDTTAKTITNWCQRTYGMSFSQVFKLKRDKGKISLRRAQFQLAEKNPAMAIFLGKNILGQTDKQETVLSAGNPAPERLVINFGEDNKDD